jgi:glycosyltransferase involved in cell wall biosynthesis
LEKRKKIALVANTTWNIYNFRLNVIEVLLKENYDVVVIAPTDIYTRYSTIFPSVEHVNLKYLTRRGINPIIEIIHIAELFSTYKRIKPDAVIHYTIKPNIYGSIIAQILKIPTIGCITGLGYTFIQKGIINWITVNLYKIAYRNVRKVVFENIDDRLLFNNLNIIDANKSVSVKGCGIDTVRFHPMQDWEIKDYCVFTFIGRFLYDKGIVEFVEAAKIVRKIYPKTVFWLIGEIDSQNPSAISNDLLTQWVVSGLVENKGFIDDVRPFIAASTCIVCPSYREAIPRVLQESLAMERPIISTDVAGCREAVEEGVNGYLVPVKSPIELAKAMTKIINTPHSDLVKMGEKGRKKVIKEFDQNLIAQDILKVIKSVLN